MIHLSHLVNDSKKEYVRIFFKKFSKIGLVFEVVKTLLWLLEVTLVLIALVIDVG